jgi:hypothetical protein
MAPAPAAPAPAAGLVLKEVKAMLDVATDLKRHAAQLPRDSALRAELVEAAEYYLDGAEQAWSARAQNE